MLSPEHLRDLLEYQSYLAAWEKDSIDFLIAKRVREVSVGSEQGGKNLITVTVLLHDNTFLTAALNKKLSAEEFGISVRNVILKTVALRGLGPAFEGVSVDALSEADFIKRIDDYMNRHPGLRWERTWDTVEEFFHATHIRIAPKLSLIGGSMRRMDQEDGEKRIMGLVAFGPTASPLFLAAAVGSPKDDVERGEPADYRLLVRVDPGVPADLFKLMMKSAPKDAPTTLAEADPFIDAIVSAVVDYYRSAP